MADYECKSGSFAADSPKALRAEEKEYL